MELIVKSNYAALSDEAADYIDATVSGTASSVCCATGNTPVGTYGKLVSLKEKGRFDSSRLRIYQLDEYLGLRADDERTLWGWMDRILIKPLEIPSENVVRLPTDTRDSEATCRDYDRAVEAMNGFDLSILGLGPNGHLGMNDPPGAADSITRVVTLSQESIKSNSVYWGGLERVPPQGMTAGMRQLLASRKILLLVSGKGKRDILRRVMYGPVTDEVPASHLQLHPNVVVIADEDAAG